MRHNGKLLTVWDVFIRVQTLIHVHGEVHHVGVAEKIKLPVKKLGLIVDLLGQSGKQDICKGNSNTSLN